MNKKILFVDDEVDICLLIHDGLQRSGFYVDSYADPLIALQNFKSAFYDLVLLDIKMPNMNGFDLYEQIRKQDATAKVCFLTAFEVSDEQLTKKMSNMGSHERPCFIQKPISIRELVQRINELMI
jgi:DNA-binding response OmpR family regulator